MDKLYYPATMHPEEDGRYSIWLSDIKGCCSQGSTLAEAVENIKDGLGLYYEEAEEGNLVLPVPSAPDKVPLEPGEFVVIVEFSPSEYLNSRFRHQCRLYHTDSQYRAKMLCAHLHWS